MWHAPGQLD